MQSCSPSLANGAVAVGGCSQLRYPCVVGDESLHPSADVRSATWTESGLGVKGERERERREGREGGGRWGSGCPDASPKVRLL